MFKFFLTLIFLLFSQIEVNAKFDKLFSGKDGSTFYLDFQTLSKNQEMRIITIMIDFLNPNESGDLSRTIKREINCQELMYRDLEVNFFKENLGKGELGRGSGSVNNPKWVFSPPGGSAGAIIKIVCNINL